MDKMDISITDLKKELDKFEIDYKNHLDSTIKEKEAIPDFQSKLNKIYDLSSEKILNKCGKELEELNKNLQSDYHLTGEYLPLPGKEKEAKITYNKFYYCSFYPSNLINKYALIENSIINLNKNQLKLCKEDCVNKSEMNLDNAKKCLKKCVDFSFNYSRKSTYELFDNVMENLLAEMKQI